MSTFPADKLLTASEVAAILRCSPCHVRALCHGGRLAFVDIGLERPCIRIPASAVTAFTKAQRRGEDDAVLRDAAYQGKAPIQYA